MIDAAYRLGVGGRLRLAGAPSRTAVVRGREPPAGLMAGPALLRGQIAVVADFCWTYCTYTTRSWTFLFSRNFAGRGGQVKDLFIGPVPLVPKAIDATRAAAGRGVRPRARVPQSLICAQKESLPRRFDPSLPFFFVIFSGRIWHRSSPRLLWIHDAHRSMLVACMVRRPSYQAHRHICNQSIFVLSH